MTICNACSDIGLVDDGNGRSVSCDACAPDLEYTPFIERLPELARASEVADLRARVTELEGLLAAAPVDELRRWLEHSSVFNAIHEGLYGNDQARADFARLTLWLDAAKAPAP